MNFPILTTLTFFPLVGIVFLCLLKEEKQNLIKATAFSVAAINFVLSAPLFFFFNLDTWQMQFVEKIPWIVEFGIDYHLGIDGISLLLLLLTTLISPLAILSTWTSAEKNVKGFMISLLLLETGMVG
ncbi:MAG: Fe-S-binding domain-containing protein, partial [Proteobacteria bacterium]|nr:Fe-S-binding domain-containing protein [Pseudomonadota bacterium]